MEKENVVLPKYIWPYRVLLVGRSAEANPFVTLGELNREKGDQRLHVVVANDPKREWRFKCEIGDGDGVQVDFLGKV